MILKRPNGKWRVKVKFRGVIVADRTFERRGDAVRWEMEQKRLLQSGEFVAPAAGRITVLALTGVRLGELRGLRVRDVVDVPYPALVEKRSIPQSGRTSAPIERATTKSGRSRLVPLSAPMQPVVASWVEGREPDDLLFPAPEGGYLRAQNWRRAVHWNETSRGRRPHDLRHTAASLWIAAGIDIKTVSAWLGHSTAKLTLDTYGHLMGTDADRAALERVNRALGGLTGARADVSGKQSGSDNGSASL
ncbi:site-specific integrase [Phycicoccus sp. M110.8]|uniref:tyrosine-type recombinase/integrase n=1 Tax=Phycicoccus sp. M110.8 TaxID=3075433 RepID=UPI0028FDAAA3|nr:site-specific integrase [Phycicoccus sp. M110.8]MDU0313173.1 site-specific integrase [Phycicoccus sp. M110.8]